MARKARKIRSKLVNALIKKHRKSILAFAAKMHKKYDRKAYDHLISKTKRGKRRIKDGTSPVLKRKAKRPGAFFNPRMRPIPL